MYILLVSFAEITYILCIGLFSRSLLELPPPPLGSTIYYFIESGRMSAKIITRGAREDNILFLVCVSSLPKYIVHSPKHSIFSNSGAILYQHSAKSVILPWWIACMYFHTIHTRIRTNTQPPYSHSHSGSPLKDSPATHSSASFSSPRASLMAFGSTPLNQA